jgi:hypothetical protein
VQPKASRNLAVRCTLPRFTKMTRSRQRRGIVILLYLDLRRKSRFVLMAGGLYFAKRRVSPRLGAKPRPARSRKMVTNVFGSAAVDPPRPPQSGLVRFSCKIASDSWPRKASCDNSVHLLDSTSTLNCNGWVSYDETPEYERLPVRIR